MSDTPAPTPPAPDGDPQSLWGLLYRLAPSWDRTSGLFAKFWPHALWLVLTVASFAAAWYGKPMPVIPPLVEGQQQVVQLVPLTGAMGYVPPTEDERTAAIAAIEAKQGVSADFGRIARGAIEAADDDRSVFFWDAEQKVLGKVLGAWNQNPAGTCVSFGWGRNAQDLILGQIASGAAEEWPGHEVATEPIYGGSRVEIGGNRLRGDGSSGVWAAQWVSHYGILFRQKYGQYDLSTYSIPLSRQWGSRGVPADLETLAKDHPIRTVALVTTADQLWTAIGNGYPVPICSNVGFNSHPQNGLLEPAGSWGHCMACRGRFVHKTLGKCFVMQQSWGDMINEVGVRGPLTVSTADRGDVQLPQGCFAIRFSVADSMVRQRDSLAMSGFVGFPARKIDWPVRREPRRRLGLEPEPMFALAP